MFDFKKERKKEIFIHADLMGNRLSCQNPKAKLSSEFGIRGFSWWKLLRFCTHRTVACECARGCGDGGAENLGKGWGKSCSDNPPRSLRMSLSQNERATKITRKSGKRKGCELVAVHFQVRRPHLLQRHLGPYKCR